MIVKCSVVELFMQYFQNIYRLLKALPPDPIGVPFIDPAWGWKPQTLIYPPLETSRPAIAGNPRCKNITAKSVHLTLLYHPTALTSTNDHLSVLRHYVCT